MASIEKRIKKNGKASYRVRVQMRGYPSKTATFERLDEARAWGVMMESDKRAMRHGASYAAEKHTVGDMIARYKNSVLSSKTTNKGYIEAQSKQLEWWHSRLKDCRLSNLTPYLINDCTEELAGRNYSKRKPATVNRYLSALNHVINTAIDKWGWLDANPIKKIEKPREPRGRVRFLSDAEREALLTACVLEEKKPLHLIVVFALSTGARKSEILGLKRKDVDLQRQVAVAYDTKNGDPRQLYLWDKLVEMLAEWLEYCPRKSPFVFCSRNGTPINIEVEWRRAMARAGITDFRFHDLRHTAASYMAMNGASPSDIAEALGHKSYDMVKRYSHLSKTHVAKVVTSTSEKMLGAQA
ncbi:MAG: integrase [Rickettsiales bacterium]|nr:integrase [Rickettsiales bacterium]